MNNLIGISGKIGSGKDEIGKILQYLESGKNGRRKATGYIINYNDFKNKAWREEYLSGFEIKKFGGKLKDIVCLLIGCTREQLEDRDFKEKELGEEWWIYKQHDGSVFRRTTKEFYDKHINSNSKYADFLVQKLTPRKLMQLLGTEAGRRILHPNIWVNSLFADWKIESYGKYCIQDIIDGTIKEIEINDKKPIYPNWIITDVRFPNEVKAIKDRGGILIRVNRPYYPNTIKIPSYRGQAPKNYKEILFDKNNKLHQKYNIKPFVKENHHESETALDDYKDWDYVIDNNGTIEELIEKVKVIVDEKI